jgi:hypothetical protein
MIFQKKNNLFKIKNIIFLPFKSENIDKSGIFIFDTLLKINIINFIYIFLLVISQDCLSSFIFNLIIYFNYFIYLINFIFY